MWAVMNEYPVILPEPGRIPQTPEYDNYPSRQTHSVLLQDMHSSVSHLTFTD
ncbi:hypothetical protein [Morganella morganii IS15]|nr:hypothetical protein [Morganella morganii IS15]